MSILFDKLKGLKKEPDTSAQKSDKLSRKRNVYNFRQFVFSPVGSVLSLLFIVLFGILSFYSLYFLKTYIEKTRSKYAYQTVPKQTATPDGVDRVEGAFLETDALAEGAFEQKPQIQKRLLTITQKELSQDTDPTIDPAMLDADSPVDLENIESDLSPATNEQVSKPTRLKPVPSKAAPKKYKNKLPVKKVSPPQPQKTKPSVTKASAEEIELQKIRLFKQKKMESISKISLLTKEIEDSLSRNNIEKASKLIQTLSRLKPSKNNHYLIKLEAFIEIKAKRYERAAFLLSRVLDKTPEDLEAGINMAVVEIKMDRIDLAKKRLIRLRQSHPSSSKIHTLLNQL